jgi:nitrogen fixation/metabolism regulation signal transduction histidine kinase
MALQEPARIAYAEVTRLWVGAITLVVFTVCFALFVAMFLAKSLSRPIENLIAGIEVVASGNLEHKVEAVSNDELGKLATIFNNMTVKIKEMQEEIKKTTRLSSIGQMANILGHEIRNPLSAMTNSIYLIKRLMTKMTNVNPIMIKSTDIIESEIKSTSRIIDNMLDFSRTRPPVLTERDLISVVNDIMAATKVPDNIKLQLELTGLYKVMVDIEEIKQVVRNLVNNAIDAMSEMDNAMLKLRVKNSVIFKGNASIPAACLDVMDTGCGMKPDVIKKIFEPFFSTKSKGTGLGLAVVAKIVEERHSGVIEVNSVPGRGTTFSVKLPLKIS